MRVVMPYVFALSMGGIARSTLSKRPVTSLAFRPGYGDSFATPRAALEYANEKMQRLLAEYENDRKTASTGEGPAVRSVYRLAASSARDARGQLRLRDDSRRGAARRSARHKTRQKARQDDSFLYLSNCL